MSGRVLTATVNYVWNAPPVGADRLEFVTEDEARSTMRTTPGREVEIRSARGRSTSLDVEGFELVPHESAVDDFDAIESDPDLDRRYAAEMEELVMARTGASRVLMLGGAKRRHGERALDELATLTNAKPARYPHADNTDDSAGVLADLFDQLVDDFRLYDWPRWAMYNVWRCTTPPPQDIPLAVCDSRSVSVDDEVTVTAVTATPQIGELRHDTTSYRFNPEHRWSYFPDMTDAEVIVFKSHDTDPSRARRVPHTAFDDPTCPPVGPTRASAEARALALFS